MDAACLVAEIRDAGHDVLALREQIGSLGTDLDISRIGHKYGDIVAKVNGLWDRIVELDFIVREQTRESGKYVAEAEAIVRDSFEGWAECARMIAPHLGRWEGDFGEVEGSATFRANLRAAESALVPDDEFFRGAALERLAAEAIAEYRAGKSEPLDVDGLQGK